MRAGGGTVPDGGGGACRGQSQSSHPVEGVSAGRGDWRAGQGAHASWGSREPDGELSSAGDPRLGWGVGLGVESGTATRPSTNQEARSEVRDVPVDGRRGSPILSAVLKPPKGSTSPTFPHTFAHQATLPLAHDGVQPAARGVLTRPPTRHA